MVYRLENGALTPCDATRARPGENGRYLGIFPVADETAQGFPDSALSERLRIAVFASPTPRFISQENLDVLCVCADMTAMNHSPMPIYLFLERNALQIFCGDETPVRQVIEHIRLDGNPEDTFGEVICEFFRQLLSNDGPNLDEMECGINQLEDAVLESQQKNFTKRFIYLRKRLMALSHYYEELLDVFDGVELNENGLFEPRSLKHLRIIDGKVGRLYANVQHLRDYVTQVREAYQSEVDISLNKTMKLFTVLTAIFLPLTLLAGWYGMNFDMPEYRSPYGYPILIVIGVLMVIGTIWAFKRKKWF